MFSFLANGKANHFFFFRRKHTIKNLKKKCRFLNIKFDVSENKNAICIVYDSRTRNHDFIYDNKINTNTDSKKKTKILCT